jgi:hypothetical protein
VKDFMLWLAASSAGEAADTLRETKVPAAMEQAAIITGTRKYDRRDGIQASDFKYNNKMSRARARLRASHPRRGFPI